ncbi:molybdopterin-dependent oxidoreductase [Salsipaludibacter albus]|uniref:molybdopterin-dependent oxidoreductase n=1 Tax=Salsipaludibacter albus TaxID=2849650 RepID=UPI001EE43C4C|nr:molybdopterin-dependent oxidoreductase [Salsipaludibacter albus]MBY5163831.1 molybdopterin-dependent oxidoreductase [Salsipaludibacter albus]
MDTHRDTLPPPPLRVAIAGVLAALAGVAAGELVAGLSRRLTSPVVAIGDRVVDAVPQPVKQLAIDLFGTNDKLVLLGSILLVLVVVAAGIGLVARRHLIAAMVAALLLAGAATLATALGPTTPLPLGLLPGVATAVVALPTLWLLVDRGRVPVATPAADDEPVGLVVPTTTASGPVEPDVGPTRRRFVLAATSVLAGSVLSAGLGRLLGRRFSVADERADLALPEPADVADAVPAGAHPDVEGLSSFVTSNRDFYRIDTALEVPQLSAADWTLRVHGMVDEERTWSYGELLAMPSVERVITMTCVSNEVGGGLVGTARWQGVRLADLLETVGVDPAATQVVGRAHDGFTAGFPVEAVGDRDCLVAWGMNDEPLPAAHGFPLRLVTPGLYGYVSATKWLSEVELTTFDALDAYWVERGWAERAPIKVSSRIDTPEPFARLGRSTVAVAGVAWAQTRGIDAVEVRVDDGEFREARLATAVGTDTWRQWVFEWDTTDVEPGRHQLTVRATDADGTVQREERTPPFPEGATGWHSQAVFVDG